MSFNPLATVNVGDIVRVAGKRGLALVVRSNKNVSEDRARGDSYSVDEFDAVKFDATHVRGSILNPKVAQYYFTDGSMRGAGTGIARSDVVVVGTSKVATKTVVEYIFSSAKMN